MSRPDQPIFDAIVRIDRLPAGGRSVAIDADEAERQAIAEAMTCVFIFSRESCLQ